MRKKTTVGEWIAIVTLLVLACVGVWTIFDKAGVC